MIRLEDIQLIQFKNHINKRLVFPKRIQGIIGKNGTGKTNILDAIYFLIFSRSYFTKSDKLIQHFEHSGYRVDGRFHYSNGSIFAKIIYREDGKKEYYRNDQLFKKASEYIGFVHAVFIAPDDIAIINEGSEVRRRFLDTLLCQADHIYLQHLQQYQKLLQQRNALLKEIQVTNKRDNTLLEFYANRLSEHAGYIFNQRVEKIKNLREVLLGKYLFIAGKNDGIDIQYESQLQKNNLKELLDVNLEKDIVTQRTNYGIHKDDLILTMQENLLKNIASQGQKKSFLLALKLAEYTILQKETNTTPILLLDDIFERLDESRIEKLFAYMVHEMECQVFITDTNRERLESHLNSYTKDYEIVEL